MLVKAPGFGGNAAFSGSIAAAAKDKPIIVRRTAAIGDALCTTVVCDKLIEQGYKVVFQTHPSIHCVIRRHTGIVAVKSPQGYCDVDLDNAYEKDPNRKLRHFHDMFMEKANLQLAGKGIKLGPATNCKPRLRVGEDVRAATRETFKDYPRPWVFICPRSNSYTTRTITDGSWVEIAKLIQGTKFWLGTHPAPPGIVDLHAKHFDNVIEWIAIADLLVTVDTGPMHVAAALNIPIVAIEQSSSPQLHLNDQNDYITVAAPLDCLNCQLYVCPINQHIPPCQNIAADVVAAAANAKLSGHGKVSVVIPTFKAPTARLTKCIVAVLPQCDEIIVTKDAGGEFPEGRFHHPKVQYVSSPKHQLGFGKNVNYGVRHSNGEFLLILNDDCFLAPDAVAKLREVMTDRVGVVGHLLRYPDGRICHAGKHRKPGMRGWGLNNNREWHPTIKEPIEMENVTGTSILVRREAFYDVGGFDEDFYMYCEDDAFTMAMRKNGWKIMYQPNAFGIHEEAQTSKLRGNFLPLVYEGNATFNRKWGWWLDKNINTVPGVF